MKQTLSYQCVLHDSITSATDIYANKDTICIGFVQIKQNNQIKPLYLTQNITVVQFRDNITMSYVHYSQQKIAPPDPCEYSHDSIEASLKICAFK